MTETRSNKPAPYRLQDGIGYHTSKLSKLMQTRLERGLAPYGVSRLKWCALSGIGLEGQTTPSALARHIGITRPATSRLLKALVDAGLIARATQNTDARTRVLRLTDDGQHTLDRCLPVVLENQEHFHQKLKPMEIDILHHLLDILACDETEDLDSL